MCLPSTWRAVNTRRWNGAIEDRSTVGAWVEEPSRHPPGHLRANAFVRIEPELDSAHMAAFTVPLNEGEISIACNDCYELRNRDSVTRHIGGQLATLDTALISGGFEHQRDVPTVIVRWHIGRKQRLVLQIEDPDAASPASLMYIVETVVRRP